MSKGSFWTDEDKNIIVNYSLINTKEEMMSLLPDRTWKAIRHMGIKLGLKLKNDYKSIPEEELFMEVDGTNHMLCKSCLRYLPFSMTHYPKDKNCRLGFRSICKECKGEVFADKDYREKFWSLEESEILINNYENETNRYIQSTFLPHKTLEQINHRASVLNLLKREDIKYLAQITSMNDEWRNKISNTRATNGLSKGENNPMYGTSRRGKDNPNWQGGISELYQHLRRNLTQWKLDSAKDCNYECVLTGLRFDDIHHLHSFHLIIEETLKELDLEVKELISEYSDIELTSLTDKCLEIHYRYPLGVCLTMELHNLFHAHYGYFNNTKGQFEEFVEQYISGKFKEVS